MAVTRWINVDSMSILRRYVEKNIDEFSRRFDVFFLCNFDGQKIHAVSTYFIRHNIDERKIDVVSMYFLQCNFDGKKIDVISMYFFQNNFDWRKVKVFSMYFDAILMMCFWKKRIWWSFWYLFLIIFGFIKIENCLDVSFQCNFVLM